MTAETVAGFVGRITVSRRGCPVHPWIVTCPACASMMQLGSGGVNNPHGWHNRSLAIARARRHAQTHLEVHGWIPGPVFPAHTQFGSWEQDPRVDDGHAHLWELVTLLPCTDPRHGRCADADRLVRCRHCRAPRCHGSGVADPCMERRHHDGLHIHLSGRFEPVGGLLP